MAGCEKLVSCDNNLSWESLVKLLIAVSSNGCPAVRTIDAGSASTNYELRDDGGLELRDDGGIELRD